MTGAFIGLAFIAALNPKLLAVDLLFMESRRPRLMFGWFLLGGMAVGLTIGLLDVFVLHADAIKSQGSVSAGIDLAVGLLLLAAGALVWTGRLRGRRRKAVATSAPPDQEDQPPAAKDGWAQRLLGRPRPGLAFLIGAVAGTPGAAYITALHQLITGSPRRARRCSRSLSSSSSSSCWCLSRSRSWNYGPRAPRPGSITPRTGSRATRNS